MCCCLHHLHQLPCWQSRGVISRLHFWNNAGVGSQQVAPSILSLSGMRNGSSRVGSLSSSSFWSCQYAFKDRTLLAFSHLPLSNFLKFESNFVQAKVSAHSSLSERVLASNAFYAHPIFTFYGYLLYLFRILVNFLDNFLFILSGYLFIYLKIDCGSKYVFV